MGILQRIEYLDARLRELENSSLDAIEAHTFRDLRNTISAIAYDLNKVSNLMHGGCPTRENPGVHE